MAHDLAYEEDFPVATEMETGLVEDSYEEDEAVDRPVLD